MTKAQLLSKAKKLLGGKPYVVEFDSGNKFLIDAHRKRSSECFKSTSAESTGWREILAIFYLTPAGAPIYWGRHAGWLAWLADRSDTRRLGQSESPDAGQENNMMAEQKTNANYIARMYGIGYSEHATLGAAKRAIAKFRKIYRDSRNSLPYPQTSITARKFAIGLGDRTTIC